MTTPSAGPEYVAARTALLDVLEVLELHRHALILIGAQAVYHHAPVGWSVPSYTTDADIALDPDLLATKPDIADQLANAGYQLADHGNPGHWIAPAGIAIDLMLPKAPPPRSARLIGHGKATARNTAGIQIALHDNQVHAIGSLSTGDSRTFELRIAGPASLIVAKSTKLRERIDGPVDRISTKDASDMLRLLRNVGAETVGRRLRALAEIPLLSDQIQSTLGWLSLQTNVTGAGSSLVALAIADLEALEPSRQVDATFRHLLRSLVEAFND